MAYSSTVPAHPDLCDRIRAARADLGWKQKHLAAEVHVEPITVSRWERGATTPDLDTLRAVAQATGRPVTYFVAGGEQTFPVYVWGIARVSVPPQVNVVASAIFVIALAIALANVLWQYRSAKRLQGAT